LLHNALAKYGIAEFAGSAVANNENMYSEISKCRISGSSNLITVLSLGEQYLTGVFPKTADEAVTKGPLDLVWCPDSGLLQLKQSYNLAEMYGDNYGYRSGLNLSMVAHLEDKIKKLVDLAQPAAGDLVVDIGSNDATSLKAYPRNLRRVGIDPTGIKFKDYYDDDITLIPDFFSAELLRSTFPHDKAKIITSISTFYDLESPAAFVRDIETCLADDGIWHFEQSYMPSMLKTTSYDTVCHEHLEFYSLTVVKNLLERCGLRILEIEMNAINGGSFAVTACKVNARLESNESVIDQLLKEEQEAGLNTLQPYVDFKERVFRHRAELRNLIGSLVDEGKKIFGYGASTKGNVLLQFCGISSEQVPFIAEVNEDKFGSLTPGTHIPIVSEVEAKAMKPDYFLVLPWHFRNGILAREQQYLAGGGKFIFPLPEIEIV
jgi:hypothetical protein